ncbi:metallophosphoesterase [Cloacibacillus evryensis]|uniref:Metallophosphoesterase n=2 Tax=Cloacibacillus evryensis TaxID=508460 RepID=A0AAW5K551_9BACT|nr:metallophosphoesterase [Cloacibacillus evryensis]MCQ4814294.1 metallophosphoesterase [Cloacibacillus evryensis]
MATLRIPPNIPKPTLQEMRECPIIKQFDDLGIWFGINPPCIDAKEMVLHLSDTPYTIYPYLRRALHRLRPAWIVHTGDFVDNVKLEQRPGMLDLYQKRVKDFLSIFEEEDYGAILVTGNHDHVPTLLEEPHSASVQVWTGPGRFSLGQFSFSAGHTYEDVSSEPAQYNLYGHNLEHTSGCTGEGRMYLNGLQSMYLIHIHTGEVTSIPYPPGTDSARLQRKRVSL